LKQVDEAQNLGVRTVFVAEDIGCRDAFEIAGLVRRRFPAVSVAVSVTNPFQRSPETLLASALTQRALSPAPFILGLGSSSPEIITRQLGEEHYRPLERLRIVCEYVRSNRGGPILMAAMGPKALGLAAELTDIVLLNTGVTPGYARWASSVLSDATRSFGRPLPQVDVWVPTFFGVDPAGLTPLERATQWAARMLSTHRQGELLLGHAGFDDDFLPALRSVVSAYPHSGSRQLAGRLVPEPVVRALTVIEGDGPLQARLGAFFANGVDAVVLSLGGIRAYRASA
jgi:alkanesulfonate monooxygenase SsuD/methylene tetrahydromethanopterin reductase-like flavin-dependent oxidoreductase (luciferase family)